MRMRDASTMRQADLDNPIRQAAYQDAGFATMAFGEYKAARRSAAIGSTATASTTWQSRQWDLRRRCTTVATSREAPLLETPKFELLDKP